MFGLVHPNQLYTPHINQPETAGRELSPRLWNHALMSSHAPDGRSGFFFGDDFLNWGTIAASGLNNGYYAYIEVDATVGSVIQSATHTGGVITLLTSTDAADGDNHQTSIGVGGNVGTLGAIGDAATGPNKLTIFEARFQLPSVTDGDGSIFIGLGEEGLGAAATPLLDSSGHTTSSDDLIGFLVTEDDNDALKFVHRKAGSALQTTFTWGTALAASTWYKVGFVYDPTAPDTQAIKAYINNDEQTTYVTKTDGAFASTFPDGEELTMYASIIASGNNDPQSMLLDWWAFYQEN